MSLTVVYVVQILLRIIWIVDNQSSTQSITVLVLEVAVIPERPLNNWDSELVDNVRHGEREIPLGLQSESHT